MSRLFSTIIGLLATTALSQAQTTTISVTGAANSTARGATDLGIIQSTALIGDDTAPPQNLEITVANLNIDGVGGDNDSVVLTFTVTTDGQNLQTSGTTANGWFSSGGTTLNANGEFVQVDYTSMSVDLNGELPGTGSGNGISDENFLGFTGVGFGSWGAGHVAVVNGISQAYVDGTADKHLSIPGAPTSVKSWFDTTANTGAALDSAGTWRPENFDFQFEVNITPPVVTNDILYFHAVPSTVRTSGDVTVYWSTSGGDSFSLDDGSGPVAVAGSGSQVFNAVSVDTTFTFTAVLGGSPDSVSTSSVDVRSGGDPVSYEETIMADGPIAYYRFEENVGTTQLFDYTANIEHSTEFTEGLTGLEFGHTGAIGSAARFNGAEAITLSLGLNPQDPDGDDFIDDNGTPEPEDDIPDTDLDGIEGWSVEMLVQPDAVAPGGGNQVFTANQDGTGSGRTVFYLLGTNASPTSFLSGQLTSGVQAFEESWMHLIMTVSHQAVTQDYTMRMYLDGALIATFPNIGIPSADGNWVLGAHKNLSQNFLTGLMDEVSIYDFALDDPDGDGDLADSKVPSHFAAYIQDGAALLSFGTPTPLITKGDSGSLQVVVGDAAQTVTIDNGVGAVVPVNGVATAPVSPTEETTYTVTVNDGSTDSFASATIVVIGEPQITATGFTAPDGLGDQFFEVTAINLLPGVTYELYYSDDLPGNVWNGTGATMAGDGANPVTFTETLALDPLTDPRLFYQIWTTTP